LGRTVDELLGGMSSRELTEWIAYSRIEPFGGLWEDFRTAQICAAIANYAGKALKEGREAEPDWFMPTLKAGMAANEAVLLDDPEAQAAFIMAQCFGTTPEVAYRGRFRAS